MIYRTFSCTGVVVGRCMAGTSVDLILTVLTLLLLVHVSTEYLTQVQSENMGSGVLIFRTGHAGIGKNQKMNGKNGGWVGGPETFCTRTDFLIFSKITDDPLER